MPLENVTFIDSTGYSQAASSTTKELGKDDFLNLLITQLSNQDPLEPMQDTEFIAQLAQFSSLEQMENMNSNLSDMLQWDYLLSQTISNTMATSLIGRTARVDSSQVYLETGGAADIAVSLDRTASEVTVTIRDESGNVVRTLTEYGLDAGDHIVNWDGTDSKGAQVASGVYTIELSAVDGNGNSFTPTNYLEGKVEGVTYKDGIALLSINGQEIPLASVLEVKEG